MAYRPLHISKYKPHFHGHQTFPFRYGWLKKAYDAVAAEKAGKNKPVFGCDEDDIVRFGVGVKMVPAIKHWAIRAGIIEVNEDNIIRTTALGDMVFLDKDPYMENISTLWLLHWKLVMCEANTTWFWAFNHFNEIAFSRQSILEALQKFSMDRRWWKAETKDGQKPQLSVAENTLKKDLECFIKSYAPGRGKKGAGHETILECPLVSLELIKTSDAPSMEYRFVRGPKKTVRAGMFLYALIEFWRRSSPEGTMNFDRIMHDPASPGRIFRLDEDDVARRLSEIEISSKGLFHSTESAGLRQIARTQDFDVDDGIKFLEGDYPSGRGKRAA